MTMRMLSDCSLPWTATGTGCLVDIEFIFSMYMPCCYVSHRMQFIAWAEWAQMTDGQWRAVLRCPSHRMFISFTDPALLAAEHGMQ